ncbi:MAG: DeoR/GlpR family DNA-binding transcription regulator [Planctomycetota bacterium]|jgi:DeoR/GlpR family transcriptional regulator of sugar metabolism
MPRSAAQALHRQRRLAKMLSARQDLSVAQAARRFGVSETTIRRDLKALEESGACVRCYGGAVAAQRITFEFAFDQQRQQHLAEKTRIGAEAAELVQPGWVVMLDTGTTTLQVTRALARRGTRCTVITSSLVIASELWGREDIKLMLAGGQVRPGSPDLVGPATEAMLEEFTADVAFLGSDGIDPARGCFTVDVEAARVCQKMAAGARRVVVVADSSKLASAGAVRFLKLTDIDDLVTDTGANAAVVRRLRRRGVNVVRV